MTAPRILVLSSAFDAAPRAVLLDRPMTVAEAVARHDVPLRLATIAVLTDPAGNSVPVMRGEWHVRQITEGYQLSFVPVPGRGSFGSILAAIAGIALAVFAPWAAGTLVGLLGLTGTAATVATSLIGAGIMIAGQFIINRLLPKPGSVAAAEPVYTARASSNRAMPLEPIPELFGRLRYPPPYASRPYAEFVDNDQYLYQLHCLGAGHIDPERWEIGDTLVWTKAGGFQGSFAGGDTTIEIIQPGDEITTFPANVITAPTVDGQPAPDAPAMLGPFTVNPPGTEIDRIACDYVFPLGLIHINKDGAGSAVTRSVTAQYRRIDNDGAPLGGWTELIGVPHTAATRTPQRFSRGADVERGRYEVRFGASGTDLSDNTGRTSTLNRVLWAGLRGYVHDFETPAGVTMVATRIRATEHLAREASGQYLFTCQRLLPTWSEEDGWSEPVATRSPAWAAAAMLKALGLSDHEFDLAWLAAYADVWHARGDRFDAIFDRRWVAAEALDAILRVGRAYHVRLGSIIGFVRDEPKAIRRMAFTPDTIVSGSVRRHDVWFSEDAPDHLEVAYLDADAWRERTVMAAIGAVGADKPQQETIFGITDHDHAWREGIFKAAENAYRRSFRTFQVEREGRMAVRGDPVVLHDPVFAPVAFARIDDHAGSVLTINVDIDVDPEETYHVLLRDRRGREWGPCLVSSIVGRAITLDAADHAAVAGEHGALNAILPDRSRQEAAHVAVLRGEQRLFDGLLVDARPVGPQLWEVTLVNDDQRVHVVDETEIMPAPWTPPSLFAPVPDAPVVTDVFAIIQRGTLGLTLEAGWQPAPGADRYVAEISYDPDADEEPESATWSPVYDGKATRLSTVAMPQPATLRVAGIGRLQGPWAYCVVVDIPRLQLPAEVSDPLEDTLKRLRADQLELATRIEQLALGAMDVGGRVVEESSVAVRFRNASAVALQAMDASITDLDGDLTAQAAIVSAVQAAVGNISGDGLWKMEVVAGTGDVTVRAVIMMRATIAASWVEVGTIWEAGFVGGNPAQPFSRQVLIGDQVMFADALGNVRALFGPDGLTIENVKLGTLIFNLLKSSDNKLLISGGSGGTYLDMFT